MHVDYTADERIARKLNFRRRQIVQAMLACGSLTVLPQFARAQTRTSIHELPRRALVIGNGKYRDAPLKNPVNDATALARELKQAHFDVALQLDAGRDEMLKSMQAFSAAIAARNAIGLFYFAGHGVQLAWRNYLIPIDAGVETLEDVRTHAVELNTLLQSLTQAKNAMNVIILDACRDNPFGTRLPIEQRGLSQFDAPPGSLLAYATAPGNVASDGEGSNGLYTENLLRELSVPEAKIEDVFKRVRASVRRRSNGRQIPWESTSLEDDFYFRPPKSIAKLSAAAAERQFEEELALWEGMKETTATKPLEDYLQRYPSGRFSELAQLRLDQLLAKQGEQRIAIVSSIDNPFSKGSARADTNFKVGDNYTYRVIDLLTGLETERRSETIKQVSDTQVIYDSGRITDLLGNLLRYPSGQISTGGQYLGLEYALGKRWVSRSKTTSTRGGIAQVESEVRVIGREDITVPAGTFYAFVLEADGWAIGRNINTRTQNKRWLAPDRVRLAIATERLRRSGAGRIILSEREELVSYRQA